MVSRKLIDEIRLRDPKTFQLSQKQKVILSES